MYVTIFVDSLEKTEVKVQQLRSQVHPVDHINLIRLDLPEDKLTLHFKTLPMLMEFINNIVKAAWQCKGLEDGAVTDGE